MPKIETPFDPIDQFNEHNHNGSNSKQVSFGDIKITPNSAITAPSGGSTVDSQARTAINALITELENRGFINEN